MNILRLKFFWEWHATSPFWNGDDAAFRRFGAGEIDPEKLGLPSDLIEELSATAAWHDTALNWSYPPDPGPWRQAGCVRFNTASKALFERCQKLLTGKFELRYVHPEGREDRELDAYLGAPSIFTRKSSQQHRTYMAEPTRKTK